MEIAYGLIYLFKKNLLSENRDRFIQSVIIPDSSVLISLMKLYEYDQDILTQDTFNFVTQHAVLAAVFSYSLCILSAATLLNPKNLERLSEQKNYASGISRALCILSQAEENSDEIFITQAHFEFIIKNAAQAENIAEILKILRNLNQLTLTNFNTLIRYADFINEILIALKLKDPFPAIIKKINEHLNQERMAFLMADHVRLGKESPAKIFFHSAISHPKYLAQEIFEFLPRPR